MALISTQAAGSVKGFGFTRPYIAPPSPAANSQNAVVNLSMNHNYDGTHNNAEYSGSGTNTWATFKDETGNNHPQPKHNDYNYKNTFHSHLSPYHPGGWSCEFNNTYALANYVGTHGNNPGTGACTWEAWVYLHPHHAGQISGAGSSNRNMVISGRDTNYNYGAEQNGNWTFGIAGNQSTTATGVYLIYRNGGTTYKKYWYQGNPVNAGIIIPRGKWHHLAIVRSQGTDASNVYKCYMNGTQLINSQYDTFPDNMDHTSSGSKTCFFGGYTTTKTGGTILDGKIKDYALTHSAKYTSNFTPSTRPMSQTLDSSVNMMFPYGPTFAIGSGQSNVIVDNVNQIGWLMQHVNSSGNFQSYQYANRVSMVRSSPYDYIVNSAKSDILGSVYMNAQNVYHSGISQGPISNNIGTDPGIVLGTNDFTIEFWYYMNGTNAGTSNQERQTFVDFRSNGNTNPANAGPYMYYWKPHDNGGLKIEYPGISMSNHKVHMQQWVHVAIVRSGDLGYLYINGNQSGGTGSLAGRNFNASAGRPMWGITAAADTGTSTVRDAFHGYMTDCRITVGTAVYTGNFKPPIGRLTLTGGDYPDTTNVNVAIPTGHVKQLLSFTNTPLHDTAGKEQYMHPWFYTNASYPANDIILNKADAEAANFNGATQETYTNGTRTGSSPFYYGFDLACDSDGETFVTSAPYDNNGGSRRGSVYIHEKAATATFAGGSYDNVSSPQVRSADFDGVSMNQPKGILFNADGTKLYLGGMSTDYVYQWSLSSPYSITSGSFTYDNKSYYIGGSGKTEILNSMKWNNDGTKLYTLCDHNNKVFEHDLSTAYDISTASYNNVSFSHSSQMNSTRGFGFTNDGTKMYIGNASNDRLMKYNLSTAWDLSTASYSNSYYQHLQTGSPGDVYFDDAGTRMFLLNYASGVQQYTLSVANDPTTGTVTANTLITISSNEDNQAMSFAFNGDKSKFFTTGPYRDRIYQYSTGGAEAVYTETVKLANPYTTNSSYFGWTVDMNDAGTRVVAGMPGPFSNNAGTQGYAYVYEKGSDGWPTTPTATLQSSDFSSGDLFGKGVGISGDGNYVVVGAERENGYPGNYSWNGSAYVFKRVGVGSATETADVTLISQWSSGSQVGYSSAITKGSNGYYYAFAGGPYYNSNRGSVQVANSADGISWNAPNAYLTPSGAQTNEYFGFSVAADGDYAVVGAYRDYSSGQTSEGAAFIYYRASGNSWSQQARIEASDGVSDLQFARYCDISNDTIVAGTYKDCAYVFTRSGTSWSQQAKLVSSDLVSGDKFGNDVAIHNDTIVAGAMLRDEGGTFNTGAAYVFTRSGTTWSQQAKLLHNSPAVSDDFSRNSLDVLDDYIAIGVQQDDDDGTNSGSVLIFKRTGTSWSYEATLTASDAQASALFGYQCKLGYANGTDNTEGYSVLITARDHGSNIEGKAYLFTESGGTWTEQLSFVNSDQQTFSRFGWSADMVDNKIVIGCPRHGPSSGDNIGAFYTYSIGPGYSQQAKLSEAYTSGHNDNLGRYFGQQIAIDTDGDTVAIGAPAMADGFNSQRYNSTYGHAEVWVRSGTTWSAQAEIKPADADRAAEDGFGGNLALSGDGNTLVVGQKYYYNDAGGNLNAFTNSGNAWVFTRSGTTWTLLQKLSAGTNIEDWFGFDVDITKDANYITVSAPKENTSPSNQAAGKVFVFRKSGNAYSLQGSFQQDSTVSYLNTSDDQFGYSLAIANNASRILTGAVKDDGSTGGTSSDWGAVFSHTPSTISNWPTTEPSQVGGASTAGKNYLYFNGGYNDTKILSKLIYPTDYDNVNKGTKGSAVFQGMDFTTEQIDGYAFTVEAWIYPMQPDSANTNTEHHLWSYGDPDQAEGIISLKLKRASSSDTTFQWVFEESRDRDNDMASNNNFNQWYHVAISALGGYDQHKSNGGRGAEYRFFVNGVRDTTISNINTSNYNWLMPGGSFVIGGQHAFSTTNQFDSPRNGMGSYGNGYRNFTGIIRNFRVERTNKYWGSNFTPTDLTSI